MLSKVETELGDILVEVHGYGTPVLMLHGSGSCRRSFEPQLEPLSRHHRTMAWDAPGYGGSSDLFTRPNLHDYAETVRTVAEELSLGERVHLVGASWGGLIAIAAASEYPTLFRSLALLSPSFGTGGDLQGTENLTKRIREFRSDTETYARRRTQELLESRADPLLRRAVEERMLNEVRHTGFTYALTSMLDVDMTRTLNTLHIPIFMIWGALDHISRRNCRAVSARNGSDWFKELPAAGHLVNQECPETINKMLAQFWDQVDKRSG